MATFMIVFSVVLVGVLGAPSFERDENANSTLDWRIVGGSKAPPGGFPYQISLRGSRGSHTCGGSIISERIILTAAHCVKGLVPSKLSVVVGSNKLNSGGTRYEVNSVRPHAQYNFITLKNDIAILRLSTSIRFSSTVMPIELETSNVGANVNAVLSGWGLTSYPGSVPNDLQYINLRTMSVTTCKNYYQSNVDNSQICTFTRRGQGACRGDSGGPLVANGLLTGIVSWGRPCAAGYPDVFTRVSSFIRWIKNNSY